MSSHRKIETMLRRYKGRRTKDTLSTQVTYSDKRLDREKQATQIQNKNQRDTCTSVQLPLEA